MQAGRVDRIGLHLGEEWPLALVALAAPFLLFPTVTPAATLISGALAIVCPIVWFCNRSWPPTCLRWPLLGLSLGVVAAAWFSPFPSLSVPKLCGFALGLLLFGATLSTARTLERVWQISGLYFVAGLGTVVFALFATDWLNKFPGLSTVTAWLPARFTHLPGMARGVHPNALAGTTLSFLPVALCLLRVKSKRPASGAAAGRPPDDWRRSRLLSPGIVLGGGGLLVGVLAICQSRTAWMALAATLVVFGLSGRRRLRIVTGLGVLSVACLVFFNATLRAPVPATMAGWPGADLDLAGRIEIWSRALAGIQDFPLTGMGLNAFRAQVRTWYPLVHSGPGLDIAHAHNLYLETALDVGLPGLVCYVALLLLATTLAWQVVLSARSEPERRLAMGLWGAIFAGQVFGITDAIVLGAKVGLFFWLDLGLIVALHQRVLREQSHTQIVGGSSGNI